jgi:hypothetical protein
MLSRIKTGIGKNMKQRLTTLVTTRFCALPNTNGERTEKYCIREGLVSNLKSCRTNACAVLGASKHSSPGSKYYSFWVFGHLSNLFGGPLGLYFNSVIQLIVKWHLLYYHQPARKAIINRLSASSHGIRNYGNPVATSIKCIFSTSPTNSNYTPESAVWLLGFHYPQAL